MSPPNHQTIDRSIAFWMAIGALSILLIGAGTYLFAPQPPAHVLLPYEVFKQQVANDNVINIKSRGASIEGHTRRAITGYGSPTRSTEFTTALPAFPDSSLESLLEQHHVSINQPSAIFLWDLAISASSFSTLGAVLAGFVLIGIVAILTFKPGGPSPHIPLLPLLTAFLALVVAAFFFAVNAGAGSVEGRLGPVLSAYCLSWILALGVVQTSVGIVWLLTEYQVDRSVVNTARWIVHVTIGIAAVATAGMLVTPLYQLTPKNAMQNGVVWVLTSGVLLTSIPFGLYWNKPGSVPLLRRLTLPTLLGVAVLALAYAVLTALPEAEIRTGVRVIFGILLGAQVLLWALCATYEASLPILDVENDLSAADLPVADLTPPVDQNREQ